MPTVFVILGATGDLMRQKLVPALFHLYEEQKLPKLFQVVGFSRDSLSREEFQSMVQDMAAAKVQASADKIAEFSRFFVYRQGMFEEKQGYKGLAEFLGMRDKEWQVCSNKLFYLAVPPQHYKTIFENLHSSGLTKPCSPKEGWTPLEAQKDKRNTHVEPIRDEQGKLLTGWTRVIVEKPFGKDLETAQELDRMLGRLFREEQIYRMDHYLGKETVQNILAFRFSNSFLEPAWNKDWIESVSIRLLETSGIGKRALFYEGIGALRDVGQNHMLQLLALFLMDTPSSFEGENIRKMRAEVFKVLKAPSGRELQEATLRGQYKGYLAEQGVAPDSVTETYFRIETSLHHTRWKGVPIVLESGKAMKKDLVEVRFVFRHQTPCLCPDKEKHYKNILYYTIEPDEGARMSFFVKKPGSKMQIEERAFTFNYREAFLADEFQEAYERLLLNVIEGDQTLFVSTEEIMASWKFIDSILRGWEKEQVPLVRYPKGASTINP